MINHINFFGREVISAYWFDGSKSSLIYRFSPSHSISDKSNEDGNSFFQSIGHYWEWASLYCCGSLDEAGKVMGLAAFGEKNGINKRIIDEKSIIESLMSFKRAGANAIITYFADTINLDLFN